MKRAPFPHKPTRRVFQLLAWAAAITLVACVNDVNFNPIAPGFPDLPTGPTLSDAPIGEGRDLEIVWSLWAGDGSCVEVTVLYDGVELMGARTVCPNSSGCAKLELRAFAESHTGHHEISYQVIRQSKGVVAYLATGTVRVSRDGLFLGGATLPLEPTRARLRAEEAVSFDVNFRN